MLNARSFAYIPCNTLLALPLLWDLALCQNYPVLQTSRQSPPGVLDNPNSQRMAVPSNMPPAAIVALPTPESLSDSINCDTAEQIPIPHMDFSHVIWPSPTQYTAPGQPSSDDIEVQPFPDLPDPCNNLIIGRTLLLDKLHFRATSPGQASKALPGRPFQSLYSRIESHTGHIKEHEDLNRCRVAVSEIVRDGEALRSQRAAGNAAKLVRLRGHYPDTYHTTKHPEPKQILKEKLKERARGGIVQALAWEKEVGWDLVDNADCQEILRGRSNKRQPRRPPGPTREDVIRSLLMLRETYPSYYKSTAGATKSGKSDKKVDTGSALDTSYRDLTEVGQARFTLRSVKKKASIVLRRVAVKFGLPRAQPVLTKPASSTSFEGLVNSPSSLGVSHWSEQMEDEMVSDHALDHDLPQPIITQREHLDQSQGAPTPRSRFRSNTIEQEQVKRQGFFIQRGTDMSLEQDDSGEEVFFTPPTSPVGSTSSAGSKPRSRLSQCSSQGSRTRSASLISTTSSLSTLSSDYENLSSRRVAIYKPCSPPRVVSVKHRKRLQKRPNINKVISDEDMRNGTSWESSKRESSSKHGGFTAGSNFSKVSLALVQKIDRLMFARRGH